MTMKRIIRADGEIERLAMANCLMLLSRVGGSGATAAASTRGPRVFACKTCNREFQSFQALGGHRASHRRPRLVAAAGGLLLRVQALGSPAVAKPKTHECSICGLEFTTGQALGGHTRRHRAVVDAGESMEATVAVMMKKSSSSSSKRVLCLDLNLTPYENDLIKVKKMASWFIA